VAVEPIEVTSSGAAFASSCFLHSVLIGGSDGTNDITVTVYDSPNAASGTKLLPTHTVDASALGLNGVALSVAKLAKTGVYVEITTDGTASVVCDIGQP